MSNYYIIADSLNKIEIASRILGGIFTNMFKEYLSEIRSYKDYNFSNDLARRIFDDAKFAEAKIRTS